MSPSDLVIAPARGTDAQAVRLLLPQVMEGPRPDALLARLGARVVGAAAFRPSLTGSAFEVAIRVVHPARRQGVGRALLRAVEGRARESELEGLASWGRVEPDSGARFLEREAFRRSGSLTHFRAEAARGLTLLSPLLERAARRRAIPSGFALRELDPATRRAVADLHVHELGGLLPFVRRDLDYRCQSAADLSRVLLERGDPPSVAAFVLLSPPNAASEVHAAARVVAPGNRGRWVNVKLMHEGFTAIVGSGAEWLTFESAEDNDDTLKLAQRLGAEAISVRVRYTKSLGTLDG